MDEQLLVLARNIIERKDLSVTYEELIYFLSEQTVSSLQDVELDPGELTRQLDHHEG